MVHELLRAEPQAYIEPLPHYTSFCPKTKDKVEPRYVDIFRLSSLFNAPLPFAIAPAYLRRLQHMSEKIGENEQIGCDLVLELASLLQCSWAEILHNREENTLPGAAQSQSVWQYLITQFAPIWQYSGQYPSQLLPQLLHVIDWYFAHCDQANFWPGFLKQVGMFMSNMTACPVEDLNRWYAYILPCNGVNRYLLDVFLDCFQQRTDLSLRFSWIAKMIFDLDPSLQGSSVALKALYQQEECGAFFSPRKLGELLLNLEAEPNTALASALNQSQALLKYSKGIDRALLKNLEALYVLAWESFRNTSEDYLRWGGVKNKAWIRLAQYLAAAALIPPNYYKYLIPTLRHDEDLISGEALTLYPLSYYILSSSNRELIFLPNCVQHHKSKGTFYNCNQHPARPLTAIETYRLSYANQQFVDYFNQNEAKNHDAPLPKAILQAIKTLCEKSFFNEGLIYGKDYNPEQLSAAEKAYQEFLLFSEGLEATAYADLYHQHIVLHGNYLSFREVMEQVQKRDGECIAVASKYFMKLCIDYDPYTKFHPKLEQGMNADILETLRRCSTKKIYKEYCELTQEEAKRRLVIIFTSLMTHSFQYLYFTSVPLKSWDCINYVTDTGQVIYYRIVDCIMQNCFDDALFLYTSLMESIVIPALKEKSFVTSMTRYPDTHEWLRALVDGSLFDLRRQSFFDASILLPILHKTMLISNNKSSKVIEGFLDQMLVILLGEENPSARWIRINIKFTTALATLPKPLAQQVLSELRAEATVQSDSKSFNQHLAEFIVHRLACQLCDASRYFDFFKGHLSLATTAYSVFSKKLQQQLQSLDWKVERKVRDVLKLVVAEARKVLNRADELRITDYLQRIGYLLSIKDEERISYREPTPLRASGSCDSGFRI